MTEKNVCAKLEPESMLGKIPPDHPLLFRKAQQEHALHLPRPWSKCLDGATTQCDYGAHRSVLLDGKPRTPFLGERTR